MQGCGAVLQARRRPARKLQRMRLHNDPVRPRSATRAASAALAAMSMVCCLLPLPALGQPATQSAAAAVPPPQVQTPQSKRDSATAPGTLRPERPAVPQMTVPLQIPPPPASAPAAAIPPNPAASAGGVSDAVARCEAKTSAVERAQCRRDLAQQATPADRR